MGATTYRLMSGFAAEGERGTEPLDAISKFVFSPRCGAPVVGEHQLVSTDAVEPCAELKEESDGPCARMGSLALCRSLLKAGLVDRFRVVRLSRHHRRTGRSASTTATPTCARAVEPDLRRPLQLLDYVPTVLDGPPGV